jgi:hypothetical protein
MNLRHHTFKEHHFPLKLFICPGLLERVCFEYSGLAADNVENPPTTIIGCPIVHPYNVACSLYLILNTNKKE